MRKIECEGGMTQIGKVMAHALRETEKAPVQALVFIGDAMEENLDELALMAAKLGAHGVPIFLFQEGRDPAVRKAFRLLALKSAPSGRAALRAAECGSATRRRRWRGSRKNWQDRRPNGPTGLILNKVRSRRSAAGQK
jgi:hypothetical protein